jgi:biopolymer transport protein ExbD
MTLTITADERVLLNGRAIRLGHLEEALRAAGFPERTLIMRADRKIPSSFVSRVLEAIRPCTHSNLLVWETTGIQ